MLTECILTRIRILVAIFRFYFGANDSPHTLRVFRFDPAEPVCEAD